MPKNKKENKERCGTLLELHATEVQKKRERKKKLIAYLTLCTVSTGILLHTDGHRCQPFFYARRDRSRIMAKMDLILNATKPPPEYLHTDGQKCLPFFLQVGIGREEWLRWILCLTLPSHRQNIFIHMGSDVIPFGVSGNGERGWTRKMDHIPNAMHCIRQNEYAFR